jgi:hypothetical protein
MSDDPIPPLPPSYSPPKSTLVTIWSGIKFSVLYCYNWEQANPRKTAAILLYISTHSTHLKPVLDMLSIITGMPLS